MVDGHGDDLFRYGGKVRYNFSSNIYSGFDQRGLKRILADRLDCISSYPEPSALSLEVALSEKVGISPENICVTAGAVDAIYRLAGKFRERTAYIYSTPTFSEYHDACKAHGVKLSNSFSSGEIVWICNPNNPDGKAIPAEEILNLARQNDDKIFIVDRSYSAYCYCNPIPFDAVLKSRNIVLVDSFTKRFGIPGLRLGIAVGDENIISDMKENSRPWNISQLSIEAGKYLLEHQNDYIIPLEMMLDESYRIGRELEKLGLRVVKSETPFFLAEIPEGTASELKEFLVENYGILIRDASNFNGLSPRHFRISVQTPAENDIFINAMKSWIIS